MGPIYPEYRDEKGPPGLGAAVEALASRQYGVVWHAQLLEIGLSRQAIHRRIAGRQLVRIHQGVYAVGHRALTRRARELAAVMACGPDALLSHRAAGARWGVLRTSSPRIEVTAPRGRKPQPGIVVHRSRLIHHEDRDEVDGIPVMSVARTLVDLADVLRPAQLERTVNEAELLRLLDVDAIARTQQRLRGRRGRGRLERVLAAYRPDASFTRSRGERELRRICREHSLPAPHANLWIAGHEVDLWWPDARLVVEVDGEDVHRTTRAFHEDRKRDRELAAHGIQVLRVTSQDLRSPRELAAELKRVRARRLAARAA